MSKKCVFAIGPESTGSMLIAKVCAHVLSVAPWGEWNGVGWCDRGQHKICHCSLPYSLPPQFPDVRRWIAENEQDYDLFFVLTTRDVTLSELSRCARFGKNRRQVAEETERARQIMIDVMQGDHPSLLWSYETFLLLREAYLPELYGFLGVESDFMPRLVDGNKKRIEGNGRGGLRRAAGQQGRTAGSG